MAAPCRFITNSQALPLGKMKITCGRTERLIVPSLKPLCLFCAKSWKWTFPMRDFTSGRPPQWTMKPLQKSCQLSKTFMFCPAAIYHVLWMATIRRSEEHTSELQSRPHLVCRLLLEKKKTIKRHKYIIIYKHTS